MAYEGKDNNMKTLAAELAELAEKMKELGANLDYYGGFDMELAVRGRQLVGAGQQVQRWADDLIDKAKH